MGLHVTRRVFPFREGPSIIKNNEATERLGADSFLISSDPDQMKRRKIVVGSNIGGIKKTKEMINFAAKHFITAYIEVVSIDDVNIAMERLVKADVRYRFVIDIANTMKNKS
ncbi:mannitol dehydrogenase-like [Impatiens glandulifera]|uniref:mannitol dehydrogenase-like n=1 Tax=Impatiens glandulifera TaxID=253017 RepID=UPI001FB09260|nr:mannitol dehydrogenase-like [Impatiens glandulifera]